MDEQLPILPQDIPAEQAVLGSIFIKPDKLVTVAEYLQPTDFFRPAHRIIYGAMLSLSAAGEAIDPITMRTTLEASDSLAGVGGLGYIAELVTIVPTSANVEHYAKIVAEKAQLRAIIANLSESVSAAYGGSMGVDDLITQAEQALTKARQANHKGSFKSAKDIIWAVQGKLEERANSKSEVTGLATGFVDYDRLTTGLHEDNLIVLAARPAMGKTALALNMAQHVAVNQGKPVAIFSLEMGAESLMERMLAAEGAVKSYHIKTGRLDADEWQRLVYAQGKLYEAPIHIDESAGIRMAEIRSRAKKLAQEVGGLGLIVIDYLQLITGSRNDNRQQEVSEISRQLKILAKELKVPVIALSQLSRSVEQRQDKRPVLSDLRESGSIEQDADIVAFLYREEYYNQVDDGQPENNVTELIVSKNRHGSRGTIKLYFHKEYTKFSNVKEE